MYLTSTADPGAFPPGLLAPFGWLLVTLSQVGLGKEMESMRKGSYVFT